MENETKSVKTEREELEQKKKQEAERKRKEAEIRRFREQYFSYYDDVKTNIREDW